MREGFEISPWEEANVSMGGRAGMWASAPTPDSAVFLVSFQADVVSSSFSPTLQSDRCYRFVSSQLISLCFLLVAFPLVSLRQTWRSQSLPSTAFFFIFIFIFYVCVCVCQGGFLSPLYRPPGRLAKLAG
jgi:hypothetical protein